MCRSVLRGCVLPSSPPMSWAPLPTASSLAAQWCRGLTCPAFQTCTLTSCTSYCPDLLPPTQVLLVANSLSSLSTCLLVYSATSPWHALHALWLRDLLCCSSPGFVRVTVPPVCVCVCSTLCYPRASCHPLCGASQPLEWPWTLLWTPCQSCWALSRHQSPSAQAVPRYVQQVS